MSDVIGMRPWVFEDRDDHDNVITLTVLPTPDDAIMDVHTYRDTGYPYAALSLGGRSLDVPEGSTLQTFALAALGITRMSQLEGIEVSVNDVPTAPAVDIGGQA